MKKIYWWFFILILSARWIFRVNLGDVVRYRGRKFTLVQGVCKPNWDLVSIDESKYRVNMVHESDFKKVKTLSNYWHSFRSGYRFYMKSWFDIWCHSGIEPWMRNCRIW